MKRGGREQMEKEKEQRDQEVKGEGGWEEEQENQREGEKGLSRTKGRKHCSLSIPFGSTLISTLLQFVSLKSRQD